MASGTILGEDELYIPRVINQLLIIGVTNASKQATDQESHERDDECLAGDVISKNRASDSGWHHDATMGEIDREGIGP